MSKQRDPAQDKLQAILLSNIGRRSGEPQLRLLALDFAADVDRDRGEGHEFGREVLRHVLRGALPDYFVRGMVIPSEEGIGRGSDEEKIFSTRQLEVFESVARAFGVPEGGVVVRVPEPEVLDLPDTHGTVTYDYTVPGMDYLQTAVSVIGWNRRNTLFV